MALAGAVVAGAAAYSLAVSLPSRDDVVALVALLAASVLVHTVPLPLPGVPIGGTSLASVFTIGAAVLYGWEAAALLALLTQLLVEPFRTRAPLRITYNGAVHALAGFSAGAAGTLADSTQAFGELALAVAAAAAAYYAVNVVLVGIAVARSAREPLRPLLRSTVVTTGGIFAILGSLSMILVVLWLESPFLAAALVGPLAAVALYQRSLLRELRQMRLARTDALTGLGNRRDFEERVAAELDAARAAGSPLAICLLDLDDLKLVNDRHGHPAGDGVLAQLATLLRQDGEAFRLGGDEFALVLPDCDEDGGLAIAQAVIRRAAASRTDFGEPISVTAGVAAYPRHGLEPTELVGVADIALYSAKREGKQSAQTYGPELSEVAFLRRLAEGQTPSARLRAAAALASAVDARDSYLGTHSRAVGELAALLSGRLGVDAATVEQLRLAGALHDVGKLAVPQQILGKPGVLTEAERVVVQQHPLVGFRLLDSLELQPIARWIRHHHEAWDGTGYPDGLAREEIPRESRILFVADAYDAMTTERVYGPRLTHDQAVAELVRCAGTQFDPDIVAAFIGRLTRAEIDAARAVE